MPEARVRIYVGDVVKCSILVSCPSMARRILGVTLSRVIVVKVK